MKISVSANATLECAASVADELRRLIAEKKRAIALIGVEARRAALINSLVDQPDLDWTRVVCFHTRELIGQSEESPGSERAFLIRQLVRRVPITEFHGLRGEAANLKAVCANYEALLRSKTPDVALIDGRRLFEAPSPASSWVLVNGPEIALSRAAILRCRRIFVIVDS